MNQAIYASNLSFSYGKVEILEGVNFSIPAGALIGIIGPNGGGKTTLLKLLLGFITPSTGKILLLGKSPVESREKIGYVPQINRSDRDFPITVLELVMLGALSNRPFYPAEAKEKALYWIEELGLFTHRLKSFTSLSGGLAQRALLARALVADPALLFLDEPTANVDQQSKELILDKLHSFRGKKTILLVTHDLKTTLERVDQILCIDKRACFYPPHKLCHHFAFGLYHPPAQPEPALHVP